MPQDNEWLEHIYKTFNFFVRNTEFNSITANPYAQHLNIDPISVASNNVIKLDELRETQKRRYVNEIRIPIIEIPILDEEDERYNEGIQEKHKGTFLIGGRLKFNNNVLDYYSYSICIVFATQSIPQHEDEGKSMNIDSCCLHQCGEDKRIIRRIHFDYQPNDKLDHPLHVQIGGEFPNSSRSFQNLHYCFDHFLSRPRIPYEKKYDYVSLFDFMINEFDSPLNKWRNNEIWEGLLDESKRLLDKVGNH